MRKLVILFVLLGLLAACGQTTPATPPNTTSPTGPATAPPAPTGAPTSATLPTEPTPGGDVEQELGRKASAALAQHLGVSADQLTLISVTPQTWSDSSLGCPDPDRAYAQVIVEGYLIVVSAGGQNYPIHTSSDGLPLILCQNGQPVILSDASSAGEAPDAAAGGTPPAGTMTPEMQQMRDQAIARLATDLGIAPEAISVIESEATTWSDGSLGCPQPGVSYIQVLIEGYRFLLEANGTLYELHTDNRSEVVRCPEAS